MKTATRPGVPARQPGDGLQGLVGDSALWMAQARCAETDPELFYPGEGGTYRQAKTICVRCPVRDLCLEYALEQEQRTAMPRFGMWGGFTPKQRAKLARNREAA